MKNFKTFLASLTVVAALALTFTPVTSSGGITTQGCHGSYANGQGEIVPCGS